MKNRFLLAWVMMFAMIPAFAQHITVKGNVVDASGVPVIGAAVSVEGTTIGDVTDADGNYVLTDLKENYVLRVSCIGYESQTASIGGRARIDFVLKEDVRLLEEVVVVGYGIQKKVNLTGSVESVSAKKLEDRPVKSVVDALKGIVPGLTVTSAEGEPGEFSSFKIRGSSSIHSGGPLVLIDGIPGNINDVNPQDIENMSVLKDAAASAIYGARAAEGIILITTKLASSEKLKVEYSDNFSFNTPTRLPETNDGYLHAMLINEGKKNAGLPITYTDEILEAIKNPDIVSVPDESGANWIFTGNTNWTDLLFDMSFQQTHNLSVSKATKNAKYLLSVNYLDQNGMQAEYGPDNFDKINVRLNTSFNLTKRLNLDARIRYSEQLKRYHPGFADWDIAKMGLKQVGPLTPIYDQNGHYARQTSNPVQALREGGSAKNRQRVLDATATLSYKPVKGLTLKAVGGIVYTANNVKEFRRAYGQWNPQGELEMMANGGNGPNSLSVKLSNRMYVTSQLLANYSNKFGVHGLDVLAGWSTEQSHFESLFAKRQNLIGNNIPALNLGQADGMETNSEENEWALLSGFMRVNYSVKDRYLLEVNFRADGSSRFSQKNRWGFFPSASVGWVISKEPFMQQQKACSNLKLRLSWGQLGNQNGLGLYDHIPTYALDGYYGMTDSRAQWIYMKSLASPDRTWETVEMTNVALDAGFFDNRLTFTGEYFYKRNKNMLVHFEVPDIIGVNVPTGNYGELEVQGWEISLGWRDRVKDFEYAVKASLYDQRDVLVDYATSFNSFSSGINKLVEGYSIGSIFGFKTDGYFDSEEELAGAAVFSPKTGVGDIKYVDISGPEGKPDGVISAPFDLAYLGTTTPRYNFGFNFEASWKGVDLSILVEGVGKKDFYLERDIMDPYVKKWNNFSHTMHNDYWREDNKDAAFPRPFFGSDHNCQYSSHWLQNAAYVRLKNLQIGYSFPEKLIRKIHLTRLRLYFSGDNLCEYSKLNKYFDPEINDVTGLIYPLLRNYSFGINVSF